MLHISVSRKVQDTGVCYESSRETNDATEGRMQSANKAFWKDILIFTSKDVPWKVKCQRLVDHVNAVFASGSENCFWTMRTKKKIKRWETKTLITLVPFQKT